jgi:general secretion pathway protein I
MMAATTFTSLASCAKALWIRRRFAAQKGVTLIEVLVAFVVLALTMGVILQIFSGGLRNARLTDTYTRALLLAESRLEVVGTEQPLVAGETTGRLGNDLSWRVRITPWWNGTGEVQPSASPAGDAQMRRNLYEVKVRVAWQANGRERAVDLTTLRMADVGQGRQP